MRAKVGLLFLVMNDSVGIQYNYRKELMATARGTRNLQNSRVTDY
jgi:hypothetical protein